MSKTKPDEIVRINTNLEVNWDWNYESIDSMIEVLQLLKDKGATHFDFHHEVCCTIVAEREETEEEKKKRVDFTEGALKIKRQVEIEELRRLLLEYPEVR